MTDAVDPCARATHFRELYEAIVSGDSVSLSRFGDEEVRFHRADLARLERLITEYQTKCDISQGSTPKRRRYAKAMRFKPW